MQDRPQESIAEWESLLGGLAELCTGLASAEVRGLSQGPDSLEGMFQQDALLQLLELCHTATARELVLRMAAAMSDSPSVTQVQARCSTHAAVLHAITAATFNGWCVTHVQKSRRDCSGVHTNDGAIKACMRCIACRVACCVNANSA